MMNKTIHWAKIALLIIGFICWDVFTARADCTQGNCENGYGTATWPNGIKYVGDFRDSKYHGQGTFILPDETKYVGGFRDGKYHGQGTFILSDGAKYIDEFIDGKPSMLGKYILPDNTIVQGQLQFAPYIVDVMKNSQAEQIGLRKGDIVVEYNHTPITAGAQLLVSLVSITNPKDRIILKVRRNKVENSFTLKGGSIGILIVDYPQISLNGVGAIGMASPSPISQKTSIHVAYPQEGEQIADERVTLLGYVTSANKTKSLKLFVNRKRQFVDELWRVSPIETMGLRGYPLDFLVPIEIGKNVIEIRVLDQEGFMVNRVIEVNRIEIAETRVASSVALGKRLPDLEAKPHDNPINESNFAVVIEDWVKQTAISDYNKGNRMYDAGRLERAAYYYRKAVRTNPLTPAFFNLGLALQGLGNEHDARQAFEKACEQKEERACDMLSR